MLVSYLLRQPDSSSAGSNVEVWPRDLSLRRVLKATRTAIVRGQSRPSVEKAYLFETGRESKEDFRCVYLNVCAGFCRP
jgi:hypothetical protein